MGQGLQRPPNVDLFPPQHMKPNASKRITCLGWVLPHQARLQVLTWVHLRFSRMPCTAESRHPERNVSSSKTGHTLNMIEHVNPGALQLVLHHETHVWNISIISFCWVFLNDFNYY